MQRVEVLHQIFAVICIEVPEDVIQAFDKGAAIHDRSIAVDTNELKEIGVVIGVSTGAVNR